MKTRCIFSLLTAALALAAACLMVACNEGSQPPPAGVAAPGTTASALGPIAQATAFTPGPKVDVFTQCNIESFDQAAFRASSVEAALAMPHSVAGWVAEPHTTSSVNYWLRLEDKAQNLYLQVPLVPTIKRPDVVATQSDTTKTPLVSGFAMTLAGHAVAAGHYHAYVAAVDGDTTSLCDNGRYIDFK